MMEQPPPAARSNPAASTEAGAPSGFSLYRRREDAREVLRSRWRRLADTVLWPIAGGLALLSAFIIVSPLLRVPWQPRFGQVALLAAGVVVFLTRQAWLAIAAGAEVSRLSAEIAVLERAEQRKAAARARSEEQHSPAKLPIPAERSAADLPRPAMPSPPPDRDLPRASAAPPENRSQPASLPFPGERSEPREDEAGNTGQRG